MMPISGAAVVGLKAPEYSIYWRANDVANQIVEGFVVGRHDFAAVAFEGPATNSRFRNEETTAIRQAFYTQLREHRDFMYLDSDFVVVPPTSAKLALTGKGNADKAAMVNAALSQSRGTPFFDTLSALVKPGRKHNPEAEAIADAFGVARAASKILFQRNAREAYATRA